MAAAEISSTPTEGGAVNKIGVTLATMTAMISMIMSSTMVNVAIPDIMGAFGIGDDQAHWMATGFLASMTVSMLLNAWLLARYGPKVVFLVAVAVFSVASVGGQVSPGYEGLVMARVLQGLCAGIIQPLAMSTVFLVYPESERGRAMGWFGMGIVLGPTIGPTLGGLIVDQASWRWVFSAPVPVMLLSAALALVFLPGRDPNARQTQLNLVSLVAIAGTVLLFLVGITHGQREGWGDRGTFPLLFGAAACFAFFVFRETGSAAPLIQLRLFSIWRYTASAIVAFVFGAGMFGTLFLVPLMVQTVQGFTATKAGLMLLPGGLVAMATFPIAGRLAQRLPPAYTISVGLFAFGLSCWWLAGAQLATGFWALALMVAFGRIGLGIVIPSLNYAGMSAVPRDLIPSASGTLNFIRMTGASVGVSALALLIDARVAQHGQALGSTQTADNAALAGLLQEIGDRLVAAGVPEEERAGVALAYVSDLLALQSRELAYHDGFIALVVAFGICVLTTVLLMRERDRRN